jgi:hypothetical protein
LEDQDEETEGGAQRQQVHQERLDRQRHRSRHREQEHQRRHAEDREGERQSLSEARLLVEELGRLPCDTELERRVERADVLDDILARLRERTLGGDHLEPPQPASRIARWRDRLHSAQLGQPAGQLGHLRASVGVRLGGDDHRRGRAWWELGAQRLVDLAGGGLGRQDLRGDPRELDPQELRAEGEERD